MIALQVFELLISDSGRFRIPHIIFNAKQYQTDYGYDAASRLTSVSDPHEAFSYDLVGNELFSGNAAYNAANELLSDGKYSYEHDANGRMKKKRDNATGESVEFGWNSDDERKSSTCPALCCRTVVP